MKPSRACFASLALLLASSGCSYREFRSMEDVGPDESVLVVRVRAKINERYVNEWPPKEGERARYRFTLTRTSGPDAGDSFDLLLPADGIFAFVVDAGDFAIRSRLRYEPRDREDPKAAQLDRIEIEGDRLASRFRIQGEDLSAEQRKQEGAPYLDYVPSVSALAGKVCSLGDRQVDLTSKLDAKALTWECRAGPRGDVDFRRTLIARYPGLKGAPFLPGGP